MSQLITLQRRHQPDVERYLLKDELWNIISLDALQTYGMNHPGHEWYAEVKEGSLQGIIYRNQYMVQFAYPKVPPKTSALYRWLKNMPSFMTHGKNKIVKKLLEQLGGDIRRIELSNMFKQSPQTLKILSRVSKKMERHRSETEKALSFSAATNADYGDIVNLLQRSEVEHLTDPNLIAELIRLNRIDIVASRHAAPQLGGGRVLGTIMRLKESPRYVLLGGLYVHPSYRSKGIAKLLGYRAMEDVISSNKRVCFYFSNPGLEPFYAQGGFVPVGEWGSYHFTSKETM